MNGIRISRLHYPAAAECEGCRELDPDSTRAQVRAHVSETGHKARVLVEEVTRYDPDGKQEAAER